MVTAVKTSDLINCHQVFKKIVIYQIKWNVKWIICCGKKNGKQCNSELGPNDDLLTIISQGVLNELLMSDDEGNIFAVYEHPHLHKTF
jgi:hypothetical protein